MSFSTSTSTKSYTRNSRGAGAKGRSPTRGKLPLMLFALAPWGEIELERDEGLKGFSHAGKLFKIRYNRRTRTIGSNGDTRSNSSRGWASFLDIGIDEKKLPFVLGEDGVCVFRHLHDSAHGSVENKVRLQFFPPKKTLFWWTLRVDCELSALVDINR